MKLSIFLFLDKFFDLNNYYTFGVVQDKSFIYSLLYVVDTNFKFLSDTDQASLADKKMDFLEAWEITKILKRVKLKLPKHFMLESFLITVVEFLYRILKETL